MEIKIAIIIERVSTKAVEGHESSDFNWCNTNNHQSNDISDIDYNTHISETAMSKWLPVLRPFLGPLRKSTKEITIPSLLVEKYFKPASDLAKVGAAVHRLFKEEFETCAVQMISNSENMKIIIDSTPKQGWFVRTASCSPKVTIRVQLNKCETDPYFLQNFQCTTMFISTFCKICELNTEREIILF